MYSSRRLCFSCSNYHNYVNVIRNNQIDLIHELLRYASHGVKRKCILFRVKNVSLIYTVCNKEKYVRNRFLVSVPFDTPTVRSIRSAKQIYKILKHIYVCENPCIFINFHFYFVMFTYNLSVVDNAQNLWDITLPNFKYRGDVPGLLQFNDDELIACYTAQRFTPPGILMTVSRGRK